MYSYQPEPLTSAYPIIKETVPQSYLGYNTNNKYPQFPPLMSDGRSITATWQPEATINAELIESNGIKSNWQYRRYLTQNAERIMEYNFRESSNDVGYYKRPVELPSVKSDMVSGNFNPPHRFKSVLDKEQPFGYSSSDLKQMYLSREELNSRKISPVITQDQLFKHNSPQ